MPEPTVEYSADQYMGAEGQTMKAPSPPAPRPSEPRDTGRSYTAQPRDTGRAYTALPRAGESKDAGALDKALDVGKKLRGLFGR